MGTTIRITGDIDREAPDPSAPHCAALSWIGTVLEVSRRISARVRADLIRSGWEPGDRVRLLRSAR